MRRQSLNIFSSSSNNNNNNNTIFKDSDTPILNKGEIETEGFVSNR